MSAGVLQSSPPAPQTAVPDGLRATGIVRASFVRTGPATAVSRLYETGGLRMRFPNAGDRCEGVIVNTGGGIAGGDRLAVTCSAGIRSAVVLTTQSAEKIYRAEGTPARIETSLTLESRARLVWLPQETILFDGASLERRLDAEMPADATLTVVESVVFGRIARQEQLTRGRFRDRWRIRRDGRLVFADDVRLDDDIAGTLDHAVCGNGARTIATLLYVAPKAETRLTGLRRCLARAKSDCAASAWDGLLVARFAAADPTAVRADVRRAAEFITRAGLPRVWSC